MHLYHLWLLIQKSLRYAWRRRSCRCCPKIIFELIIPIICLLFLILLRWIHTAPPIKNEASLSNESKPTRISIKPSSIMPEYQSGNIFNYTSIRRCPLDISIEIADENLLNRTKRQCPRSYFIPPSKYPRYDGHFFVNMTSNKHQIFYRCKFDSSDWCQNISLLENEYNSIQVQHPSISLCSTQDLNQSILFLKTYFALESLLHPPIEQQQQRQLTVYTWPCSSYASDSMFELAPYFVLIFIFVLVDGCIIYGFSLLFHSIIDEKHQGITELLRLISIRPILNSLAWFLRILFVQLIISIFLILILKLSFDGGIYFPYVSIWLIIPIIILWTIQVLSRSVLVAQFFSSNLKATLWSWFIYFLSFWLACTSLVRIPFILHLIASAWLPFYSIKRLLILLFRINTDLGRSTNLIGEIISIWFSMLIGSIVMWLLASYLEQVQPGKYGIARPWSWPLETIRRNRIKSQKRRESVTMQMVETDANVNTTVRVNNLTKTYGRLNADQQLAVDHVSFKLDRSTIYGLVGHNGAGKTTTMEMMCGLLSCDCGTIEIHDKDLYDNLNELQTCIGYCPQQDMLFSHLTVQEQLEFYARVRSKQNRIDSEQIQELLAMMEMDTFSQRLCHTLSGGMQRKVSILCAFVGQANVILLDEPSSSLDPAARRTLWSWLRKHKTNRTLLISSHLLDEVEELCDSVIILDSGKVRAQGTVLELKRQFGPPGDRLHLDTIPAYVPEQWIFDEKTHFVQVPDRKQLISLLEKLEQDRIKYSLENVTLDDIFLKMTSSTEALPTDEDSVRSQIKTLFDARTSTQRNHLWSQQVLGVLIRRSQVFLRRARLLPIILLLFLGDALAPLYMPSFAPSTERNHYIISGPSDIINKLPLKNFNTQFTPSLYSVGAFQRYLSELQTWRSNYQYSEKIIGIRIPSSGNVECYIPSPVLPNIIKSCLPMFTLISNQTFTPVHFISSKKRDQNPALMMLKQDSLYYCFYTLPPSLHLSIILLLMVLIICAALIIQDYSSGFHSYSLIHGIRSPIYWMITFLSDLALCLLWLLILVLIARFIHSSTFNGRFFALTPLFFIANLPFIYLLAKFFKSPIIGAMNIILLLVFAHGLYTLRVLIELFRGSRTISTIIHTLRWLFVLIFPNVNVFTLILAILRPYACPFDNSMLQDANEFSYERYSHKVLIHSLILIAQFVLYFTLLILIDTWKLPSFNRSARGVINRQDEDDDVAAERHRIEQMNDEQKRSEALVVDNLTKRYHRGDIPAVNRLTFAVPQRQCFGLLGFNGSGKTTTFRMLVNHLRPSSGDIYMSNKESIGYCPQDDVRFPALTVLQCIDYICRLHGLNPALLNNLILSQFQLEKYRNRLISNLSGGTCRRLHLALCLIGSPTLLLLDEPTAKVDPLLRGHIRLILQHRPIDTSIIFASHSMLECEQLCDRLTILVRGNARCLGSPRHLKEKYGTDYRVRLTLLQPSVDIPQLTRVENSNEYTYPKSSLANLFHLLEKLVEQNIIASNYTVQLTSLEHIFLTFQHFPDAKI